MVQNQELCHARYEKYPNGRWLKTSKKILAGAIGIQNENWVGRKLNFDFEKILIIVMYFEIFIINVVKLSMKMIANTHFFFWASS